MNTSYRINNFRYVENCPPRRYELEINITVYSINDEQLKQIDQLKGKKWWLTSYDCRVEIEMGTLHILCLVKPAITNRTYSITLTAAGRCNFKKSFLNKLDKILNVQSS